MPAESAQSAMEVADRAAEEQAAYTSEDGIAQVFMQGRHGALRDASLEPVAHHQFVSITQLFHERQEVGEVVAVIGIAHDYVPSPGSLDAAEEPTAVASDRHVNY